MRLFHRRTPAAPQLTTAPTPVGTLAVRITPDELGLIEHMLDEAWKCDHRFGIHEYTSAPSPVPAMMKALRMRAGAESAAAEHAGVEPDGTIPFLVHEVETVERAFRTIAEDPHRFPRSVPEREKQLVDQLHARLGYAMAVDHLGGLAVTRRELGEGAR